MLRTAIALAAAGAVHMAHAQSVLVCAPDATEASLTLSTGEAQWTFTEKGAPDAFGHPADPPSGTASVIAAHPGWAAVLPADVRWIGKREIGGLPNAAMVNPSLIDFETSFSVGARVDTATLRIDYGMAVDDHVLAFNVNGVDTGARLSGSASYVSFPSFDPAPATRYDLLVEVRNGPMPPYAPGARRWMPYGLAAGVQVTAQCLPAPASVQAVPGNAPWALAGLTGLIGWLALRARRR